ncbi:MAG TPA: anti-sigma factor [Pseudonocardiaceae bacterium]|jgi:anti-sigma-K factor RskA|nr:anti-sigma factor [Pseudonocardiaceae bacterium]
MIPDLHTLTGAYSVDALDDRERGQFERHLAACPDCAREVAELRSTASRLGAAISEEPPERLRERVLAEIKRVRQDSPGGLRLVGRRGRARPVGAPNRWLIGVTSVAAAVAIALATTFGVLAVHAQHQLTTTQGELAAAAARYAPVARVLGAPDVQSVSTNGTAGGNATAVVSHRLNEGVFLAFHMPATPNGKIYQAWAIGVGDPRSIGFLSNAGDDSPAPIVLHTLAGTSKIGVTVEPTGGSKQPTTGLVILFNLPT